MTRQRQMPVQDVVFVAMGAGGGIGRVEQQTIAALHWLAEQRGIRPVVLTLASPAPGASPAPIPVCSANGSRVRLTLALWSTLMRHPTAFILFAHVNLAPLAALIPLARAHGRSGVWCHGIEVWRTLHRSRRWALRRASVVLRSAPIPRSS